MPVTICLVDTAFLMLSRYHGSVTFDDFWSSYSEAYKGIEAWSRLTEVADLSPITDVQMSMHNLRDIARESAVWLSDHNVAAQKILIAPQDLTFGLARVYYAQASFSAHETVHVVRTRAEAADILGMEKAQLERYLALTV